MMISDDGTIIRMAVENISTLSRATQGVRLMRLLEGSKVVAVTTTEKIEETPDDEEILDAAEQSADETPVEQTDSASATDDLTYQGDENADLARLLERAESDDEDL